MKTPIAYYGGKQQLAGKIVRILAQAPAQKIYCEPFFGGGAVLYTRHLIKTEEVIKTGSDLAALPRDMRGKIEANLNEDRDLKNGVSDIFSGLTKNAIGGRWGHKWDYWEKPGSLEKEAVAHFFEARAAGGRKLEIMKAYFPSAYGYFESTLKGF